MPQLLIEEGLKKLGKIHLDARTRLGYSIEDMRGYILERTGKTIAKSTISNIEKGHNDPKWDTLAIISAAGYLINPATNRPYTTHQLFQIACSQACRPTAAEEGGEYAV